MGRVIGATLVGISVIVTALLELHSEADKQKQKEEDKKKRLREAKMQLADEKRREVQRKEIEEKSLAQKIFTSGLENWQVAWDIEVMGVTDTASMVFQSAQRLFVKAFYLDPTNPQYAQYAMLSEHKINGNALFNEGFKLHEEGNTLKEKKQYTEAIEKYLLCMSHFKQAMETGECADSWRFHDSINLVNTLIDSLVVAIEAIEVNEQKKVLQEMSRVVKGEEGTEVVTVAQNISIFEGSFLI